MDGTNVDEDDGSFKLPDYTRHIEFNALAASNKDFRDCLNSSHGKLNFKNAEHLRALTKALLLRDFKVQLHLPANRLCPPVPIRWLYVRWIQDLVESTRPQETPTSKVAAGLDIGVGSSCIYPLLVCASKSSWRMYGTDIDLLNYHHAVHNVSINQWDDRITLVQTKSEGPLIPLDTLKVDHLNFTMCNPPFFATKSEALATFSKDEQPFAACTGADVEMITPGGEVAYIRRMMEESLVLRDKVQWYTVQLGKWISLVELVKLLRSTFHCSNWVVNVLQPSGQTVRWVLGWSWMPYRATDVLARHKSLVGANLILEPNEMTLIASTPHDPRDWVRDTLQALPLDIRIVDNFEGSSMVQSNFIVRTDSAVWSRNARRKREREERSGVESREIPDGQIWPNIFTVMVQKSKVSDQMTFSAHALWTKGEDRAMFESFCGMLKSKRVD